MDKEKSILIVEDHALTLFALKTTISTLDFVKDIFEVQSAKNAFEVLKKNKIDLIILDLGLPQIDGIEALKTIRETNKDVKIIILTSHCEKEEVLKCLESGINAYCTKDIKPDKLCEVVKDVINGSIYFDKSVSSFVMQSAFKKENTIDNVSIKDCYNLTTQEKRVLILLASGLNNSQIAKKLTISINTTKVHVCSILQKMNVSDRTQAAIKAIRENLIN